MEKEKMKFIFLLIVGAVLAVIVMTRFFGNDDDHVNDEFYSNEEEFFINSSDELEIDLENENITDEEMLIEEEPDFEEQYKEKYGLKSYEQAKETAQEVVKMWLEEEDDETKWKELSTSSFFDEVQKEIVPYSDGTIRQVVNLEAHSASPEEDDIRLGVLASWNVINNETIISQQTKLFYVLLTTSDDQVWVVKELVEV